MKIEWLIYYQQIMKNNNAVCAMDFSEVFYDRWVSIDLDGNSLKPYFPFFY